jgi:N-ethylmaleimide reductase
VTNVPHAEPHIARRYRPRYKGTLMINSSFNQERGNGVIEEGLADLVSFGKLFISNPDLPRRFELDAELTRWDQDTFYTPGEKGYTDYPMLDR